MTKLLVKREEEIEEIIKPIFKHFSTFPLDSRFSIYVIEGRKFWKMFI